MAYFLGIDVSTTATKALLIDETGTVVGERSEQYKFDAPRTLVGRTVSILMVVRYHTGRRRADPREENQTGRHPGSGPDRPDAWPGAAGREWRGLKTLYPVE